MFLFIAVIVIILSKENAKWKPNQNEFVEMVIFCMQIKSSNCNSSWYDLRILDGLWIAMKKRFNYYHLLYDFVFENAHCAVVECLLLCVLMTRHKQRPEQSRNKTTFIFIILLLRKTDKLTDAVNCANCISMIISTLNLRISVRAKFTDSLTHFLFLSLKIKRFFLFLFLFKEVVPHC